MGSFEVGKGWREADARCYRGDRLSGVLRARDVAPERAAPDPTVAGRNQHLFLPAARHRGDHRAVEFSAGDSYRHDRGGSGDRQLRADETTRSSRRSWPSICSLFCAKPDCPRMPANCFKAAARSARTWFDQRRFISSRLPARAKCGLEILREAYTHRPGKTTSSAWFAKWAARMPLIIDTRCRSRRSGGSYHRFGVRLSGAKMFGGVAGDSVRRNLRSPARAACRCGAQSQDRCAEDPRNDLGPVIDGEAKDRIAEYIRLGKKSRRVRPGNGCAARTDFCRAGDFQRSRSVKSDRAGRNLSDRCCR